MTQATSVHIEPAKAGAEEHNRRTKRLDYVRSDLSARNQLWEASSFNSVADELDKAKKTVKLKTGRAMQAKATPIREGVVVIEQDTTLAQLKEFCRQCQEKWGIKALAIHTHMDEGHIVDGEWKGNIHAHIIWQWYDENTGLSCKLNKQDTAEMQTILAECLQMRRGKSSDRKHLKAIQYKNQAEAGKLNKLTAKVQEWEAKLRAVKKETRSIDFRNAMKRAIATTAWHITDGFCHLMGISRQDEKIKELTNDVEGLKGKVADEQKNQSKIWHWVYKTLNGYDKTDISNKDIANSIVKHAADVRALNDKNSELRLELDKLQDENKRKNQDYSRHYTR